MLTKTHIRDHRGVALCNVRHQRSMSVDTVPFSEWRELRQKARCQKCHNAALKNGWFKATWIDPQTGEAEIDTTPTQSEGSLQNGNYECKAHE